MPPKAVKVRSRATKISETDADKATGSKSSQKKRIASAPKKSTKKDAAQQLPSKSASEQPVHAKTIDGFMSEGLKLAENKDTKEGAKEWSMFITRLKGEVAFFGRDSKLRDDCDHCKALKEHVELQELDLCRECGMYKTFHYQCHYCDVMKSIYSC